MAASPAAPVIWWMRRDMRLDDNPALTAALQTSKPVICLFVWAPEEEGQFQQGRYSRWWTKHTAARFQQVVQQMGSRLIIRRAAETSRGLMQVVHDTGAKAVYFNHLYDPISLVRDHEVKNTLTSMGIECKSYNADLLYEPWDVLDANSQPFTSFTAFWSKVLEMPNPPPFPLPAPQQLPPVADELFSLGVQEVDWFMTPEQEASSEQLKFKWRPGVEGAVEKLEDFLNAQLPEFEHDRAKVDRHSTSMLSPWIHIGTISVRYIFYRVCQRQAELRLAGRDISSSCKDFLQQLGYREYSRYLSFHFPFIHERALLAHLRACPWRMDQQHFKAWRQGQTGYPLVDAAMRELWSTGWCHNRMRVVASSFMVKNLLLPWQWGLKHFWDAQMDADLECDALGWQYVAGGMSDAHAFNYIIDLEQEAQRFDPDGEYVRRWLPVLSRLPTQYIHAPWAAPPQVLLAADVELGMTYPERIITTEESKANMAYACKILESCASNSNGHTLSYPYRPPTMPMSQAPADPKADGSKPSQAHGTGTGTAYLPKSGSKEQQQQLPSKRPARAVVQEQAGGPPAGYYRYNEDAREGASALLGSMNGRAERAQQRAERRQKRRRGAPAAGGPEWPMFEVGAAGREEDEVAARARGLLPGQQEDGNSSSYGEAMSEDDVMSEEVVSNTVGLSAPQATAWSTLPEGDQEADTATRRPSAPQPHTATQAPAEAGTQRPAEQEQPLKVLLPEEQQQGTVNGLHKDTPRSVMARTHAAAATYLAHAGQQPKQSPQHHEQQPRAPGGNAQLHLQAMAHGPHSSEQGTQTRMLPNSNSSSWAQDGMQGRGTPGQSSAAPYQGGQGQQGETSRMMTQQQQQQQHGQGEVGGAADRQEGGPELQGQSREGAGGVTTSPPHTFMDVDPAALKQLMTELAPAGGMEVVPGSMAKRVSLKRPRSDEPDDLGEPLPIATEVVDMQQ